MSRPITMIHVLAVPLWLSLFAARSEAVAAVHSSNASSLRSCTKQHPHQTSYGKDACPCVGIDNLKGYYATQQNYIHVQYPAEAGASCEAWDEAKHPECMDGPTAPQWCKQSWCYVDPCNCNIDVLPKLTKTKTTFQGSPAYWSYNTCGGMDFYSTEMSPDACVMQKSAGECANNDKCAWNGKQCAGKEAVESCTALAQKDASVIGNEDCRCIGLSGRDTGKAFMYVNKEELIAYPANVGSTCHAWEGDSHPECTKDGAKPSWCSARWCFVDPCKCKAALPPKTVMGPNKAMRFQGKAAYWSYATCGSEDSWTASRKGDYCVNQKTAAACATIDKCAWNGKNCLGQALVTTCAKQRETGVLGIEDQLLSGARSMEPLVAISLVIGAVLAA